MSENEFQFRGLFHPDVDMELVPLAIAELRYAGFLYHKMIAVREKEARHKAFAEYVVAKHYRKLAEEDSHRAKEDEKKDAPKKRAIKRREKPLDGRLTVTQALRVWAGPLGHGTRNEEANYNPYSVGLRYFSGQGEKPIKRVEDDSWAKQRRDTETALAEFNTLPSIWFGTNQDVL